MLSPARDRFPPLAPSFPNIYWQGAGNRTLAYWKELTAAQARELAGIRSLAHAVSRGTGRVVLSWHNASLAAAGGWAFEDISAQFPHKEAYCRFARAVIETEAGIRKNLDLRAASDIFEMRAKRIFSPKLAQASRELPDISRASRLSRIPPSGESARSSALPCPIDSAVCNAEKYEWPGALSPHQRVTPGQVFEWYENGRKTWTDGLILLFAMAVEGQRMIHTGSITSFVLPWIDKFFISSLRHADRAYLEGLFKLVCGNIEEVLVLFWEDTIHRQFPSLAAVLEELAGRGLPFRGIGVFDSKGSDRARAEEIILGSYPESRFFALRPVSDGHFNGVFGRILDGSDWNFLRSYDSSWKDDLVFIYSGTQVFPLLPVQGEMEAVAPWISDGRARYPFGKWFRRELRRQVPGPGTETPDPSFPNLCLLGQPALR